MGYFSPRTKQQMGWQRYSLKWYISNFILFCVPHLSIKSNSCSIQQVLNRECFLVTCGALSLNKVVWQVVFPTLQTAMFSWDGSRIPKTIRRIPSHLGGLVPLMLDLVWLTKPQKLLEHRLFLEPDVPVFLESWWPTNCQTVEEWC